MNRLLGIRRSEARHENKTQEGRMHLAGMKSGTKDFLNVSHVRPRFGTTQLAAATMRGAVTLALLLVLLPITVRPAQAQTETVLYNFGSGVNSPYSTLTSDSAGNFYGTTFYGGTGASPGSGTVFELSPNGSSWKEITRYSFCSVANCADGAGPIANVIFDGKGNLYGTTTSGGANGAGVAFELTPRGAKWKETVLYSFCMLSSCADGGNPGSGLVMDAAGHLYGTNSAGVFELSKSDGAWKEQVIYGGAVGGLTMDGTGNIYGATNSTVFELSPNGSGGLTPIVLHTFTGSPKDGSDLHSGPVLDPYGNLFGTTWSGGAGGYGGVYILVPPTQTWQKGKWPERLVYSFPKCTPGPCNPSGIVVDLFDNIFGILPNSGKSYGLGVVFALEYPSGKDWYKDTTLLTFDGTDGAHPNGSLFMDGAGNLYGVTAAGGTLYESTCGEGGQCGYGVVYELTP